MGRCQGRRVEVEWGGEGSFPAGAKAVCLAPLVRAESRAAGASLGLPCCSERKREGSTAMA